MNTGFFSPDPNVQTGATFGIVFRVLGRFRRCFDHYKKRFFGVQKVWFLKKL
jgi:hypothetical protein